MVIAIIFLLHAVFITYIFIKKLKSTNLSSALIDLLLIIILFSVGWSIATMVTKIFWDPSGFGKYFDRDSISLTILTVVEYFFYRFYFKDLLPTSNGKER
jgi:uncharacterized membrane protein YhdT